MSTPEYTDNSITITPITVKSEDVSVYDAATSATTNTAAAITSTTATGVGGVAPSRYKKMPRNKVPKSRELAAKKPPPTLENFWPGINADVDAIKHVDAKHQSLPLARIKKIMKLDENAKMIAAEAPLLFAKACEYFIQELTMRAWIHTEESKRRTLQRSDIAQAIANYDQFDFLIDIVPREDIKPTASFFKKEFEKLSGVSSSGIKGESPTVGSSSGGPSTSAVAATAASTFTETAANQPSTSSNNNSNCMKMVEPSAGTAIATSIITMPAEALSAASMAQHQPQQIQILQPAQAPQPMQYFISLPGQQPGGHSQVVQVQPQQLAGLGGAHLALAAQPQVQQQQQQQIIITAGPNGQLTATPAPTGMAVATGGQPPTIQQIQQGYVHPQQQQQQPIQILQQAITPSGELTQIPITINANQLNMLRLQMQQQQQQHQQQQQQQVIIPTQCLAAGTQQLVQLGTGQGPQQNIFINAVTPQHVMQQQPQQQHNAQPGVKKKFKFN